MTRLRTAVAVICLTGLVALTAGSAAARAARNGAPAAAVSTGSTGPGLDTIGRQGWRVQSTASVPQAGAEISTPGFSTASWLSVTPDDAGAPGTEIEALLQHGICLHDPAFAVHEGPPMDQHNVFFGHNLQRCFGLEDTIGPDTIPEFMVPWWFRTDFRPAAGPGDDVKVVVNGIVGQADVWINGTEVGSQSSVRGAFASQTFDITGLVRPGTNSIALEVYPNDPTTMLTVDNVDWTQIPSDNSTGIQFPIQLHVSHALSIDNAHVVQTDAPDLSSAALTVKADVTNNTSRTQSGPVSATITAPYGGSTIQVWRSVTVPGGATQTVTFTPAAFGGLVVQHPQLWWPWQMGRQALYRLSASVSQNGSQSDAAPASTFGIRTITTFMTPPSDLAPQGVRVYAVNGRPIDFRGGGFGENLFLHYSAQDLTNQISLIKSMGLNGIRTEGKEMPADFYNQMDRAGILVDSGFQCCDFWAPNTDGTSGTIQDYQALYQSSLAIGRRLRNHPSVMGFQWSDNAPVKHQ